MFKRTRLFSFAYLSFFLIPFSLFFKGSESEEEAIQIENSISEEYTSDYVTRIEGTSIGVVKNASFNINPNLETGESSSSLAAIYTCNDILNNFSDFLPDPDRCAPRDLTWSVGFGLPGPDPGGNYQVRFFWDNINDPSDNTTVAAVWDGTRYSASAMHTYPANGTVCTYELVAKFRIDGGGCGNADGNILSEIIVWDDISNTNIGTHDTNHDPTSAGVEIGETVEVCQGDDNPVRLLDASTYNCSAAFEPEPANENRRTRWVQWIYGSAGSTITDPVIVDGVSYTNPQWPIYGTPTQQPFPPDVLAPNAITDDIQMPTTANVGEIFEVSMRSWNVCNQFSSNLDLNPPQGGANDVFQINGTGPVGTEQPGLNAITGGVVFYANDNPITRTFDIVIATKPADPVAVDKDVCNGSALPNFQITAAGNQAVEWFEDNAGAPGPLITNSLGGNSLQLPAADFEPGGAINNTVADTYQVWARYSANTGSQNCWSDPVQVDLDVRELLVPPASVSSSEGLFGFTVCADNANIVFTVDDGPPGSGTPGGAWEYDWGFAIGGNLSFVTPDGLQSRTVDITSNAASGLRRVRVRRSYTSNDDNGSSCPTAYFNFDFNIDPTTLGGTLSGTNTICLGDNTGNISLSGERGTIQGWEVNVNGGGFVIDGSLGVADPINPIPAVTGTHEYRAVVKSGVCTSANSTTVTVTVNPQPPKPTITPSGATTICEDASVTLSSSTVDANSYQWYKDATPIGGATNQTYLINSVGQTGSYTVEVIGIGPTNCNSIISDPTPVTVNPLPTVSGVMGGGAVCSGNPAPDIAWTLTGTAPFTLDWTDGTSTFLGVVEPTNTFTVSGPTVIGTYQITALTDFNSCVATVLGPTAAVTLGGNAPSFDTPLSISPTDVCDDGGGTTDPQLFFSLTDADLLGLVGFTLTYQVDGSADRTKNFDVNASGDPTAAILFSDAELNLVPGSPHTIRIVNIISPETCQTIFNTDFNFTVNPRPADPTGPVDNIACDDGAGVTLMVDAPPVGNIIHWYTDMALLIEVTGADGVVSGGQDEIFTPNTSATATYYAVVESTTVPTLCQSNNSVAVTQTQDVKPTDASIITADFNTCNTSEALVATAVDNGGFGEWVFSNGLFWREPFDNTPLGAQSDAGTTQWTIDETDAVNPGTWEVIADATGNRFTINNPGGSGTANPPTSGISWISETIDVSTAVNDVVVSVDIEDINLNGNTDWIEGWYTLDGSIPIPYSSTVWFPIVQNATVGINTRSATIPNGSLGAGQLRLLIRARNGGPTENHYFDNIEVREDLGAPVPTISDRYAASITVSGLLETELIPGTNEFTWNAYSALGVCQPASASVTITRWSLPAVFDPTPQICEDAFGTNSATIPDLTVYNDGVTGIVGSTDRTIEYYDDAARLPGDLISPPTNHVVTTALNVVYTRVFRTDVVPNCSQDGTLTFTLITLPEAIDQDDVVNPAETEFCEDFPVGSGVTTGIDLTDLDNDVVNNQPSRTVAWFTDAGYSIAVPDPTNASANNGTMFYPRVTETASGESCTNDAVVTITVNTRPSDEVILGASTQCVGTIPNLYQIPAGPPGTTYTWTVPAQFTVFGGGTINDAFILLSFPVATTQTLEVTETSPDNCDGNLLQLSITVQNSPPISAITGPAAVCENETGVNYSVTATPNTDYAWTVPVGASIIFGQGTNAIIVNFGATGGNVEVVPSSQGGGCTGGTATLGVTVNQRPILDPGLDKAVCSDDDIEVTLAVDGGSPVAAASYNITGTSVAPGLIANVGPTSGNGVTSAAIFNDNYTNQTGGPLNVTYTVVPVSAALCEGAPVNVVVTINPEPVMATGLDVNVCSDDLIGLVLNTAAGSAVAASYNITAVSIPGGLTPGGGNAAFPFVGGGVNYLANDTYTNVGNTSLVVQYTVEPVSALACIGNSLVINATIDPEPVVSTTLDATVCSDLVTGVTLNTNGVSIGAANYNLINVSIPGGLTPAGTNAAFPANGVVNTYISSDTYTNKTLNPLMVTYEVRGVSAAGCIGDSRIINLTVDPEPVMTTTLSTTVCSDDATGVTFSSQATAVAANDYNLVSVTIPGGLTAGGGNAVFPANNVAANYIIGDTYTNPTAASIGVIYEVQGVSVAGCVGDSELITVTIDPEPVIDPGLDLTVCSDDPIGLTLNTNGTSIGAASFDIVGVVIDPSLTPGVGNVPVPQNTIGAGYLSADTYNNVTNASLDVVYEVRATSAGSCVGDSEFITVTIDPEPVVSNSLGTTVCSDVPVSVTFATNGISIAAANYNLINVTVAGGLTPGGGNAIFPANGVVSGYISSDTYTNQTNISLNVTYEVRGVSGAGCEGASEIITVVINPEPVIDPALDATLCSDDPIGIVFNTNGASIGAANYNVVGVTIDPGLTTGVGNAVIPANSVPAAYIAIDSYTNQTSGSLDVIYEVRGVSAVACVGDSEFITVTIDPEPVVNTSLDATVCSDDVTALVFNIEAGSTGAANYNLVNVTIPGGLIAGVGNAAFPANGVGAAYVGLDSYSNPTAGPLNVIYEVRGVSVDACVGDSEFITITVDPEPVISPTLDVTLCSDIIVGVTLATNGTSVAATNYDVVGVTIPVGLTPAGTNAVIPGNGVAAGYIFNDIYTNQTNASINVTYEVRGNSAAGCVGDSEFIVVTIDPEPVIDPALDATVCSDDVVGVVLNTNGTSIGAANYNIIGVVIDPSLTAGGGNVVVPANGVAANYFSADTYTNQTNASLDVIYEVRGVSGAACIGDSEFITVTIDPEPVVNTTLDATICSDAVTGLNLTVAGTSVAAVSYNIIAVTVPGGLTPGGGNVVVPSSGVAANYLATDTYENLTNAALNVIYEVRGVSSDACIGDSEFITITVDPEPVISTTLDATVCSDLVTGVTLSVSGTSVAAADYDVVDVTIPVGLSPAGTNAVIPGNGVVAGYIFNDTYTNQTNASIDVTYEVRGNSAAGCVGDSEFIVVTIDPEPVIDPALDATVCSDDVVGVVLNTNGTSIGAANYNIIGVVIDPSLTAGGGNVVVPANGVAANYFSADTYTNQTNASLDVIYEVRGVSGAACIGDSEFITVTIDPEPVVNTTLDATICSDAVTGLNLTVAGTSVAAVSYNIIAVTVPGGLTPGGGNVVVPSSGVAANYLATDTYENLTNAALNVIYEVRGVSSDACIGDSEFITITVDPEPVISTTLDATVCSDLVTGVTLSVSGTSVAAADYDVVDVTIPVGLSPAGTNAVIPGNGVVAGYIFNDTYTNQTNASIDVTYEVRGNSAAGCVGDSEFIVVTIDPEPVIDPALDATVCSDDVVGVVLNTNGTSIGAANYNIIGVVIDPSLTAGGGNVVVPANGVAANYFSADTYTNQTNASLDVIYEVRGVSGAACIGDSEFITVTIDPEPVVSNGLDATVCSDLVTGLTLAVGGTSVAAANYNIIAVTVPVGLTPGGGNAVIPSNGVAAGYLSTDTYTNQTNGSLNVIYEVRGVSSDACIGDSEFITITVDPEPVISTTLDVTVCSDIVTGVTLAVAGTSVAAADYDVVAVTIPGGLTAGGTNAVVPGNGVAAGYIFNDTYTNQTNASIDVTYEVRGNSAAGCVGDSEFIVVTIDPEPVVDPGLDVTVCSDDPVGVVLNTNGTSVAAANYNIVAVTIPGGLTANGGNVVIPASGVAANYFSADIYTNQTNASIDVTYEVKGISGVGCIGDSEFIVVTIDPEPVVSNSLNATVCSDLPTGLNLVVSGTSVAAANYNVVNVTIPGGLTPGGGNAIIPANGVVAGYLATDTYTNQTSGSIGVTYEVQGVSSDNCIGDIRFITVTIDPEPVINPGLSTTVCSDLSIGITLVNNGASVVAADYDIVAVTIPGGVTAGGTNAAQPAAGVPAGYIFSDTYTNQTSGALNVIYEVRGTSAAGCAGDSEFITITIDPEPVVDPALDVTVCSDDIVGVVLATNGTSVAAADYNIVSVSIDPSLIAGGGNAVFPANNVASNYFTNDTYTNTTNGSLDVIYEVRGVSVLGCIGDSEFITVTIDPEPVVSGALNTTVCSDDAIGLTLLTDPTSVGASSYNIVSVSVPVGIVAAGTNAAIPSNGVVPGYLATDSYTNQTGGSLNVVYEVRGVSAATCVGNSRFITVTIDPEPVMDPALDASICSDVNIGLSFASDGISVNANTFNLIAVTVGGGLTPSAFNVVPANGIGANYALNDNYNNITNLSIDVVYEVQGVSAAGCVGDSEFITITIDPEPVMNNALSTTVCSDLTSGIILASDGISVTASTFNIVNVTIPGGLTPGGGNGAFPANNVGSGYINGDTYTNQTSGSITVIYEVRGVSAAGCIGDSEFINLTIDPEPVVNPGLDATVCSDDVIGVTLSTNGTSVAAADYDIVTVAIDPGLSAGVGNVPVPANGVVAGYISTDTYTNLTAGALNVVYDVRGNSAAGCVGDIRQITITIDPEPVISTTLNKSVCSDAVTGLVLNTNGVSIGASNYNIIGVTIDPGLIAGGSNAGVPASGVAAGYLSSDVYTNATAGALAVIYEVRGVSGAACEGDSEFITVTIEPGPVLDPNLDTTVCSDDPIGVSFSVDVGSVAAATYNLVGITPNPSLIPGGGNVPLANGVANNYISADTYTNTTSIALTVVYEVKGVSAATCQGPSEFITVTIDPEPVVDAGLNKTVCSDEAVGLILVTNGVSIGASAYNVLGVTIPIGLTANPGNAVVPASGVVDGYLSADEYTNLTNGPLDVIYEARGISAGTCVGDSRFITITIDPEPIIDTGLNTTVCSDQNVGVSIVVDPGSVAAVSYNIVSVNVDPGLTSDPGNVPIPLNGVGPGYFSGDSYTNTGAASLDVIYEVRGVSSAGCVGDSRFITVTIDGEPVINAALDATVCSDAFVGVVFSTNGTSVIATDYDVLSVTIPGTIFAGGGNVAVPSLGVTANYIAGDTYTNTTASPVDVVYEVRGNSVAGCVGDSEFIAVTINPEPVVNPALDATVCSREASGITLSTNGSSVAAATYNLISVTPDAALVPNAGNAIPAVGVSANYIDNDSFTNTTNADLNVDYIVEPVSPQGCVGDQETITLTIRPEPVLDPALSPAPVCSDVASGVILAVDAGSVAAASYSITGISFDPGLIPAGSNAALGTGYPANILAADTYTNTTNAPLFATYTIVPVTAAGCLGQPQNVIFTVNPAPDLSNNLNQLVCSEDNAGIVLATTATSTPAGTYDIINIVVDPGLVPVVHNGAFPRVTADVNELSTESFQNPNDDVRTVTWEIVPISVPGCRGPSKIVTLSIEPEIAATVNNLAPLLCSGVGNTDIQISSTTIPSAGGISLNIAVTTTGSVSGFIPNLNNVPVPYTINDILVNNDAVQNTVTYTITPVANSAKSGAGCTGTPIVVTVDVDPKPIATATVVDPIICSGDNTNINLTSTVASSSFTWTVVDNPLVTGEMNGSGPTIVQTLTNIDPAFGAQSVTYTITPTGPLPSSCVGNTTMAVVTVNPTATVDAGLPETVCEGENVSLSGTVNGLNQFLLWSGGAGTFSNPTSASTTYFPGFGETGNVTLTLQYTDGSGICPMVTDDVIITINPANAVYAGPGYVICEEATLSLVDATLGGSTTDVVWTVVGGGTGTFSNANILNPTFTPDVGIKNTLITLRLTGSDNTLECPDVSSDVFVTVNANPIIAVSTPDFNKEICEDDQIIYNAFGADTYQFYLDDGLGGGFIPVATVGNTATLSSLAPGTYDIKAEGTATTGCLGESSSDTFVVIQLPNITLSASSSSICENDDVTFTASGAGAGGLYQFILDRGGSAIPVQGPGATPTYTTSLLEDGDIIRVVGIESVSNSSCDNVSSDILMSVAPAPSITLTSSADADGNIICQGDDVTFTATSDIGVAYEFKIDGIIAQAGASNTFVTSNLITGSTVSVDVIGPTPTDCRIESSTILFIVNPLPTAVMTGETSICNGGLATLQFELTGRLPFTVVYNDGTTDVTLTNLASFHFQTVEPVETTTYSLVSITDANGCLETDLPGDVTITVEDAIADFSIVSDTEGCSPLTVSVSNNSIQTGITYEWNWGDGSANTFSNDPVVTHEFQNNSTTTTLTYNITLFARNDNLGCLDTFSETVDVFPSIITSLVPSTEGGCGPVEIGFLNNSLGVTEHRWYYREQGTTDENEVSTSSFISYELDNTTSSTIIYEVVYEASNGTCTQTEITEVFVLPTLSPAFVTSTNPVPVIPTSPHVTLTNNTPNKSAWTYLWEWGDGTSSTSVDPGSHTYVNEFGTPIFGTFEIVLTVSYTDTFGSCEEKFSEVFVVDPVIPIVDFEADITEGCRALTVNFTNLSIAVDPDTYFWEFIREDGSLEGTATSVNPTFTFYNEGQYTVRLTGSNPIGVTESETKNFLIVVYDLPIPSFSLRPSTTYLPEANVFFQNLSIGGDEFYWDFNVLDDGLGEGEEGGLTSPMFEPDVTYLYKGYKDILLVATNTETGCIDSLIVKEAVFVDEGGVTRVPNAFSPSPDGPSPDGSPSGSGDFNDIFLPVVDGLSSEPGSFHMLIYDRWGNLIFESWDVDVGWDGYNENGKLLPLGVYVYKLDLKFVDGSTSIRIGDVTLIR